MAKRGEKATHCKRGHAFTPENTLTISRRGRGGSYRRCRTCDFAVKERLRRWTKNYHLQRRYGITIEQRSDMLVSQDGLCAICYKRPATEVDHDHETGRVRGMLCKSCNIGLGAIGDQPDDARWLLEYVGGVA